MKKNRRDEPIVVTVHIYMEMSQGNLLCSYLYLKQAKISISFSFFFYKIGEQEGRTGWGRLVLVGRERWWGKGAEG
jgi:hypothetical protein